MNTCRVKGDTRTGGTQVIVGITENPDGTVTTYAPVGMPPDLAGGLKACADLTNRKATQRARMRAKLAARK